MLREICYLLIDCLESLVLSILQCHQDELHHHVLLPRPGLDFELQRPRGPGLALPIQPTFHVSYRGWMIKRKANAEVEVIRQPLSYT